VSTPATRNIKWFLAAPPQVLLALLMTAAVSMVVLAVSEVAAGRANDARAEAVVLRERATHVSELRQALVQAESAQRGYLLTQDQRYLQPLKDAAARAEKAFVDLKAASLNDREALQHSVDIVTLGSRKLDEMRLTVTQAEQGRLDLAMTLLKAGFGIQVMEDLVARSNAFESQQLGALRDKQGAISTSLLQQRIGVGVVVLINLAFLALLASRMIRQFTLREEHRAELERQATRLERAVTERTEELSALSTYLQTSSEREKARLARDLHDELGGILTSAKIDIGWLEGHSKATDPEVVPRLQRLANVVDEAVNLKRRVVENLRPSLLDHLGLGAALNWYVDETCRKAGLRHTLRTLDEFETVPPEMAIAIYRIVQEGLTNTIKYARASAVEIGLERESGGYRLRLSDNGCGIHDFRADHLSHGIAGMRQRARARRPLRAAHGARRGHRDRRLLSPSRGRRPVAQPLSVSGFGGAGQFQQRADLVELVALVQEMIGAGTQARRLEQGQRVVGQHDQQRPPGRLAAPQRHDHAQPGALTQVEVDDHGVGLQGLELRDGLDLGLGKADHLAAARLVDELAQQHLHALHVLDDQHAQCRGRASGAGRHLRIDTLRRLAVGRRRCRCLVAAGLRSHGNIVDTRAPCSLTARGSCASRTG